jgi:hypothetical protein
MEDSPLGFGRPDRTGNDVDWSVEPRKNVGRRLGGGGCSLALCHSIHGHGESPRARDPYVRARKGHLVFWLP